MNRKTYSNGTVYIIDDRRETKRGANSIQGVHQGKCQEIRSTFEDCSNYVVKGVTFPEKTKAIEFFRFWATELASKGPDEIIIIYFSGGAGYNGGDYTWKLQSAPKSINAFNFFRQLSKSNLDIMLLLDCYLPNRFREKKAWYRPKDAESNMEIIAGGQPGQNEDGRAETSDFTDALTFALRELCKGTKRKASFSIKNMLFNDEQLNANPNRIWLTTPKEERLGGKRVRKLVYRFKMDPQCIRDTEKIAFHRECIFDNTMSVGKDPDATPMPLLDLEEDQGYASEEELIDEAMFC